MTTLHNVPPATHSVCTVCGEPITLSGNAPHELARWLRALVTGEAPGDVFFGRGSAFHDNYRCLMGAVEQATTAALDAHEHGMGL